MTLARDRMPVTDAGVRAVPRQAACHPVLALQRLVGNRATAAILQRDILVTNVDFDPDAGAFRHGEVDVGAFWTHVVAALKADAQLALYVNQLANILQPLREVPKIQAEDVDALAVNLSNRFVEGVRARGLTIAGQKPERVLGHFRDAIVATLQPDPLRAMDEQERKAFTQLIALASSTSRAKGTPSVIPYGTVPEKLRGDIAQLVGNVTAENAQWTLVGLTDTQRFPLLANADIAGRQTEVAHVKYQGNHTNLAGWLPVKPVPVNKIATAYEYAWSHGSAGLRRRLGDSEALERLGISGPVGRPNRNPHREEFLAIFDREGPQTDTELRRSVWAGLGAGVSRYIEFATAHGSGISRIVYDVVDDDIYLTAHYKMHQGYNPFFRVEGAPKPVF